jgi:2-oxoglutarate ferredoxin oxidoreductase subunit alpha
MFGRNGECPVGIVAPATASDCFNMAIEAWRIAIKYRTPVIFLSDGYLGMGSEPWLIPDIASLPKIEPNFAKNPATFKPYQRDPETLARPWAVPGTPELEHRIGGLEKSNIGNELRRNHRRWCTCGRRKSPDGATCPHQSWRRVRRLLVLGWAAYGVITTAAAAALRKRCRPRTSGTSTRCPRTWAM